MMWILPKGVEFMATRPPEIKELTKFIADDNLAIVYKGKLLELQEEANKQGFIKAKVATRNNMIFGGIGASLPVILMLAKKILEMKKKEKT